MEDDFWWSDRQQLDKFCYLELIHLKTEDGLFTTKYSEKCKLSEVNHFREKYQNVNVHRSLKLYDNFTKGQEIIGPFVIDIDNENEENGLEPAHEITRQLADYLLKHRLTDQDFRILFSGHKGFNIEIKPESINVKGSVSDQIVSSSKKLDEFISYLRQINEVREPIINVVDNSGTLIDRVYGDRFGYKLKHPFIRLHNSINEWETATNSLISRRKIGLSFQEFQNKSLSEILRIANG